MFSAGTRPRSLEVGLWDDTPSPCVPWPHPQSVCKASAHRSPVLARHVVAASPKTSSLFFSLSRGLPPFPSGATWNNVSGTVTARTRRHTSNTGVHGFLVISLHAVSFLGQSLYHPACHQPLRVVSVFLACSCYSIFSLCPAPALSFPYIAPTPRLCAFAPHNG